MKVIEDLPLVFGGDPEFRLKKDGEWVPAEAYMEGTTTGIGTDGCTSTGELRIGKGNVPQLVARTHLALAIIAAQGLEFYGGAFKDGHAIGGHIHVSFTEDESDLGEILMEQGILALHVLEEFIIPHRERIQRIGAGYGGTFSYNRINRAHYELREPSSWLHSPVLMVTYYTLLYLTLANPEIDVSKEIFGRGIEGLIEKLLNGKVPESIVPYAVNLKDLVKKCTEIDFNIPGNAYWHLPRVRNVNFKFYGRKYEFSAGS